MSGLQRFGTGLADPLLGTAQVVSHVLPDPPEGTPSFDAVMKQREADIRAGSKPADVVSTTLDPQGRASHTTTKQTMPDPMRTLGNIVSPMNLMAPAKTLGEATLARRVGSAAVQGGLIGGMQPVTDDHFYREKTLQVGGGALVGGLLPGVESGTKAIGAWLTGLKGEEAIKDKATQAILSRIEKDRSGGGPTTQDMLDLINTTPGKPLTIADVGGENLKALMGRIARSPGEARQIITEFLNDRDLNAGLRLDKDVAGTFGGQSAFETFDAMKQGRSIAAKPLFEKAYEGGSMAPLKDQFETAYSDAGRVLADANKAVSDAQNRITQAAARQSQAGNDVYATSGANQDMRAAQFELQEAQKGVDRAVQVRQDIASRVQEARDDIASGKKGAVWSPRIQQFLDNPRIQSGIKRGLVIERDTALAEGRAMNPSDYAIVGTDEQGEPIIGKVPTMRLLAVAKEGLDRILQSPSMRNELTQELNKEGVAVDQVRREFLKELDGINPDYKAARAQWGGDTQSMVALKAGQDFLKAHPDQIKSTVQDMSPSDKEFYKLGAASSLRKIIAQTGAQGDEARRIVGNAYTRAQLRPLFDDNASYEKFIDSVKAETTMFQTRFATLGGSQSAARLAEDQSAPDYMGMAHGLQGTVSAAHGNYPGAVYHATRFLEKFLPKGNPNVNKEIARFLTLPGGEAVNRVNAATAGMPVPPQPIAPALVPTAVDTTTPAQRGQ
jgi:hypothetical protein